MSALHNVPPNPDAKRRQWPRILGWMGGGLIGFVLLLIVAVTMALHSAKFHNYMIVAAQNKASEALATRVRVQNYELKFSGISPTLNIYGLSVDGAAPFSTVPLLEVDSATATVHVVSLLQRKWYIDDMQVHRPIVRLYVDKDGRNNLPVPKSSGRQKNNTDIFDLGVRAALLDRGEIYYNDRKSLMSADLHNLNFRSSFDAAKRQYSGTLGYQDGHLKIQGYRALPHALQAEFDATPQRLTLHRATLSSGRSHLVLSATVDNYSSPKIEARYSATVDARELRRTLNNMNLPQGVINLGGNLYYTADANSPPLNHVSVQGMLDSPRLSVTSSGYSVQVDAIHAGYSLQNGNVEVRDLSARILGGTLTGQLTVQDLDGNTHSRLQASLKNISLASLKSATGSPALDSTRIAGSLNADVDASWGKSIDTLLARANAIVQGQLSSAQNGGAGTEPLNGDIHAIYTAANKQVTLTNTLVRMQHTIVSLNGTVSKHSALQVRLQSDNLHELETVSALFSRSASGEAKKPVQSLGLFGSASFVGAVRGSTEAPELQGRLSSQGLKIKGTEWKSLRADIAVNPSLVRLQNGELIPASRGRIGFSGQAGLNGWAFTQSSPVQLDLRVSELNLGELVKVSGSQLPVSGLLNANIQAHGSQLNPLGQGTITLTRARIAGEPIQEAMIRFSGNGDALNSTLNIRSAAGSVEGKVLYYPKQQGYEAKLQSPGIRLEQLQSLKARGIDAVGTLNIAADGRGTFNDPQLDANIAIPKLQIKDQTISGIALRTQVANHVANFTFASDTMNAHINGRGRVQLIGDYNVDVVLDIPPLPLAPLIAAYAPTQAGNINGQTELHATVRGPLKDKGRLEAHVTIPQLKLNYKNMYQLAAVTPIRADLVGGVATLQRTALRGTGTDLQMQGTIPIIGNQPISVLLLGTADLRVAQLFMTDVTSSGQLRFNINSFGQRTDPNVEGQVQIVNANFATVDAPLGLQNGNGVLTLTKDRLNITSFQGTVGGGTVTAKGGVVYRPTPQFDLALAGKGIRLLYPEGVRSGIDLNVTLAGTMENALARGQVNVDQLSFTPDFDLMGLAGQFGGNVSAPPAEGFSNNLQLQINVRSTSGIHLVSRELSIQGAADLNVRGTAAEPVILGRINLNGGDLILQGNRYVLQGGTVDFVNPTRTTPNISLSLNTTIQQYNISMRFEGPIDHLRTNYTSDPALPPSDIINLVAFGKTSEASAANPTSSSLGAQSVLASQVSSQVTSRVEKIAGISHLSIDPTLGGDGQNPGATVTIQQRVTSKIFVTFSSDVTSTQRQVIQLEYQPSTRMSISGTRDQNGGFGFDTRFRRNW